MRSSLVPEVVIRQACRIHFETLGTILAAFGHRGKPKEQQKEHLEDRSRIVCDFGLESGTPFLEFFVHFEVKFLDHCLQ